MEIELVREREGSPRALFFFRFFAMLRAVVVSELLAATAAFMIPTAIDCMASSRKVAASVVMQGGKGFGGGEATRDPAPT